MQLIIGVIRPHAKTPASLARRHIWDVVHATLGHSALIVSIANVGLGIVIFCFTYGGSFSTWAGVCAAALGAIALLQRVFDRLEKHAVLRRDRDHAMPHHDDAGVAGKDDRGPADGRLPGKKVTGAGLASDDDRRLARDVASRS
jgi:hypothetical protein